MSERASILNSSTSGYLLGCAISLRDKCDSIPLTPSDLVASLWLPIRSDVCGGIAKRPPHPITEVAGVQEINVEIAIEDPETRCNARGFGFEAALDGNANA